MAQPARTVQTFRRVGGLAAARPTQPWSGLAAAQAFVAAALGTAALAACGPRARVPPVPTPTSLGADTGAIARRARALAPVLLRQRDEKFALARAVAVVHPRRRVIAYHLLWRDDVHGAWIPGTIPTDEEVVWVGYDTTGAPTELWTYWHGAILHASWPRRQVAVSVQWGKHGSMPDGFRESALPRWGKLNSFYAFTFLVPDLALGLLNRPGPLCFCRSYRRYREFTWPLLLADRIDAVVVAQDPKPVLRQVFGVPYSEKPAWPWRVELDDVKGVT